VGHTDPRKSAGSQRAPNTMEQTATPNRIPGQRAVTPAPSAAPSKPEPSKVPAIPSAATTSTLIRPVKATIEEQNLTTWKPPDTQKPRPKPADSDPCPYGMYSIGMDYGVVNCAFD
jgi:hypothetical protein